jgi:hypothetical protein
MKASDLSSLLSTLPFEPLVVQLRDGRTFEIRRPGMAIVTPSTLAIGISRGNGSRLAQHIVRCPLADIANVVSSAATK